ncbi:MAG: hypothetical protein RMJ19_12900 [Gemmatales bacterium]|nr:hypothetical protein [Gemmatales bacterium]MDW8176566.1 hypothetical protein [Gemmatales bacterium]
MPELHTFVHVIQTDAISYDAVTAEHSPYSFWAAITVHNLADGDTATMSFNWVLVEAAGNEEQGGGQNPAPPAKLDHFYEDDNGQWPFRIRVWGAGTVPNGVRFAEGQTNNDNQVGKGMNFISFFRSTQFLGFLGNSLYVELTANRTYGTTEFWIEWQIENASLDRSDWSSLEFRLGYWIPGEEEYPSGRFVASSPDDGLDFDHEDRQQGKPLDDKEYYDRDRLIHESDRLVFQKPVHGPGQRFGETTILFFSIDIPDWHPDYNPDAVIVDNGDAYKFTIRVTPQ